MKNGAVKIKHGKPVLEFAAVMRSDNQMWSLPGVCSHSHSTAREYYLYSFQEPQKGGGWEHR